jgi:hypothetical protein
MPNLPTRDEIRARSKGALKTVDVPCPEFGDDAAIRLRELTGGGLVRYQRVVNEYEKAGKEGELALIIVQMCAVGDDGAEFWPGDDGLEDIAALPADVLTRLCEAAAALNGVTDAAIEAEVGN